MSTPDPSPSLAGPPTPAPGWKGKIPLREGTLGTVVAAALVLICAEFVRSGFYMGYLARVIDTSYHLPVTVVGAAWSAHLTADTLMRGPAGALLQKFGPRLVVMAGAALCLLAFALLPLAHAGWMIFVVAVLHGIGFSPLWPATMNLTADAAKEGYQGRTLSLVSTSVMPFTGVSLFIYGALAKSWAVWPTVLLSLAFLGLSLLLSLSLPQRRITVQQDEKPHTTREVARALVPLIPAALMQTLTQSMVGAWILVVAPKLGLSDWHLMALLALGGGLAFGAMPFTGKVADRGRARFAVALGYALVGLGFLGFALTPPLWALFALVAVVGLGYAFLTPGWAALITQMLPEQQRPAAWGVLMTVESGGFAAGPLLGGLAIAQAGPAGLFGLGAVLALLTAGGYTLFRSSFQAKVSRG